MVKKSKKEKVDHTKTKEERVREMVTIMKKIRELGIPTETPALIQFSQVVRDFVDTGLGQSGKIPMQEYNREIHYKLTSNNRIESDVALLYRDKW